MPEHRSLPISNPSHYPQASRCPIRVKSSPPRSRLAHPQQPLPNPRNSTSSGQFLCLFHLQNLVAKVMAIQRINSRHMQRVVDPCPEPYPTNLNGWQDLHLRFWQPRTPPTRTPQHAHISYFLAKFSRFLSRNRSSHLTKDKRHLIHNSPDYISAKAYTYMCSVQQTKEEYNPITCLKHLKRQSITFIHV